MPRLRGSKAFQQDGLGQGLQGPAACALDDAGQQHERQRRRRSATERGHGKDDDAGDEESLTAEAEGEPVTCRENHSVGDEIAGQNPGGFAGGGGEGTGDVGQGHGDDGGVEHLHEGGEHDRDRDDPGIGRGVLGGIRHEQCATGWKWCRVLCYPSKAIPGEVWPLAEKVRCAVQNVRCRIGRGAWR